MVITLFTLALTSLAGLLKAAKACVLAAKDLGQAIHRKVRRRRIKL